jgi:predicted metalloprotease with PDZ domain
MWPYDYSREQETPLLWVSEGFTSYYGDLALVRAGLRDRDWFLREMERVIQAVETNDARNYISPADSSTSTWIGYDSFIAFEVSYYPQGDNLGGLLDLSLLHDTAGRAGLDEVMRALYNEFYLRGRGFTTADMVRVINRITKGDYSDFFRRYVWGVEVPPYDRIYGYAGYKVEKPSNKIVEMANPTAKQLKVREEWLRTTAQK